jgi:hypothetical protein
MIDLEIFNMGVDLNQDFVMKGRMIWHWDHMMSQGQWHFQYQHLMFQLLLKALQPQAIWTKK